jgi:hypothetical protein
MAKWLAAWRPAQKHVIWPGPSTERPVYLCARDGTTVYCARAWVATLACRVARPNTEKNRKARFLPVKFPPHIKCTSQNPNLPLPPNHLQAAAASLAPSRAPSPWSLPTTSHRPLSPSRSRLASLGLLHRRIYPDGWVPSITRLVAESPRTGASS